MSTNVLMCVGSTHNVCVFVVNRYIPGKGHEPMYNLNIGHLKLSVEAEQTQLDIQLFFLL